MKISRPDLVNLINEVYKPARNNAAARHDTAPCGSDRLEISAEIAVIKKALGKLPDTDRTRQEKIAELARQIENNEYRVDPEELAALLLKEPEDKL